MASEYTATSSLYDIQNDIQIIGRHEAVSIIYYMKGDRKAGNIMLNHERKS